MFCFGLHSPLSQAAYPAAQPTTPQVTPSTTAHSSTPGPVNAHGKKQATPHAPLPRTAAPILHQVPQLPSATGSSAAPSTVRPRPPTAGM